MKTITKIRLLKSLKLFNKGRSFYYWLQTFNPKIMAFYAQFIKTGDLCFDIGANVGRKIEIFLKLGGRVIAVEPQPECIKFLKTKYRLNPMVTIVDKAMDSTTGYKDIHLSEVNSLSSLSTDWIKAFQLNDQREKVRWNKQIKVETTTLDELIKIYGRPDFCKIDVEGYELQVLKGLTQPISTISFELAPESMASIESCILYLASWENVQFNLSPGENAKEFNYPKWYGPKEMIEQLRLIPKKSQYGEIYASFKNAVISLPVSSQTPTPS